MGAGKLITLLVVGAGVVGFFFFVITRLSTPPLSLLYSDLELSESSEIIERLTGMGIPFQLKNEGRTIYAPNDQISTLRVSLAGEGLGGSIVGYEIFDRSDNLGTTSFVQNINRIRAIEGELARTISEINSISSARVHIVMPERQVFRQEARKPSASIVLKTRRGGLSSGQVKAIQHIVSTAVAGLDSQSISIVDQTGTLLARGASGPDGTGSSTVEESQRTMENRLRVQIESLLENVVGAGKVRAEVSVEMNLSRITSNSETFDPDSQVVVSSHLIEDTTQNTESSGAGGVTVGADLPNGQDAATGPQTTVASSRIEETTNFEISRTTSIEVIEAGEIERISVAVLVDGFHTIDAEGNDVYTPRSQAQLDQFAELVQSTIGFEPDRGDTVGVVNLEFASIEQAEDLPLPFTIMGLNTDAIGGLIERIFWGLAAILAFFMIVKPLMSKVIAAIPDAPPPSPQLSGPPSMAAIAPPDMGMTPELAAAAAAGDQQAIEQFHLVKSQSPMQPMGVESQIDVASIEGRVQDSALKKVGDIVVRHPDESAAIVRNWLYSD
jgi:flagellar M-ring protein FliF